MLDHKAARRGRATPASSKRIVLGIMGAFVLMGAIPTPSAAAGFHGDVVASPLARPAPQQSVGCPNGGAPDVALDVERLNIEGVNIEIERLRARLDLEARLGTLLSITAGLDVSADRATVGIQRVDAQLDLTVCLGTVQEIIDRTLTTVDRNPQILEGLVSSVSGLLGQTVNAVGQIVTRTVDASGNILERTLDAGGNVVGQNVVGNVLNLPTISDTTNAAGQTVRRVQDTSGAVIEVVLNSAGQVVSTQAVSQALPGAR